MYAVMLFKVIKAKIRVWQKKAILAHKNTAEMVGFFSTFFCNRPRLGYYPCKFDKIMTHSSSTTLNVIRTSCVVALICKRARFF